MTFGIPLRGLSVILHTLLLSSVVIAGEVIWLSNCQNSQGIKSSQIAYHSNPRNGDYPQSIATVPTSWDQAVNWEGRTVSATFQDGNVFTSHINSGQVAEYGYAGSGENSASSFTCWKHWQPNLYQMEGGGQCSQVYWC
ncbi:uncharacterized protein BDR25DRAFT_233806, partial [Lindgomyces ingoldianus]